jgi:hypothetical protein
MILLWITSTGAVAVDIPHPVMIGGLFGTINGNVYISNPSVHHYYHYHYNNNQNE